MSAENASSEKVVGVDERVAGVESSVRDLQAALSASRTSRRVILAMVLALIVLIGWLFGGLGARLQSDEYKQELSAEGQKYLENNSAEYMKEVQTLVDGVTPKLTKAFYDQAQADTPRYVRALNRERETLLKNLESRLEKQVNDKYEQVLADYEAILIEEFPDAKDEHVRRRVTANFRESLKKLIAKFYADQFREELQSLYDTWDSFPVAPAPDPDDLPLEKQLFAHLLDLTSIKLASTGSGMIEETPADSTETPETESPTNETEGADSEKDSSASPEPSEKTPADES